MIIIPDDQSSKTLLTFLVESMILWHAGTIYDQQMVTNVGKAIERWIDEQNRGEGTR